MKPLILIFFTIVVLPTFAHAQCVNPPAEMGVLIMNKKHKVMQYCNGDDWIGLWGGGGHSGTNDGGGNNEDEGSSDIPAGAVMAFDLNNCPAGWAPYNPSSGRFLRGRCISGQTCNDPDGVRTAGTVQSDTFKSHLHSVDPPSTTTSSAGAHTHSIVAVGDGEGWSHQSAGTWRHDNGAKTKTTSSAGAHTHTLNIAAFNSASTGGDETRPKNVTVLYCRKS